MNTLDRKGQTGLDATINIMLLPVCIIFVIFFSGGGGGGREGGRGRKGEGGERQAFFFSFCNLYSCSCTSPFVHLPSLTVCLSCFHSVLSFFDLHPSHSLPESFLSVSESFSCISFDLLPLTFSLSFQPAHQYVLVKSDLNFTFN